METIARLSRVTKTYGRTVALEAVSLAIPGGVTAVLGPNGAGKSTMVDILAGLRRPSSGRVEVLAGDPRSASVRRRLGLIPQQTGLPWRLTVAETLDLICAHYPGVKGRSTVVETLELGDLLHRRNGSLSGGQRRRVALATALVSEPDLVFLDEPTVGLDAESRGRLWDAIAATAATGRAVLLTTHDMPEAERLAEHVVILSRGQVARVGSVSDVCAEVGLHLVEFRMTGGRVLPASAMTGAVRVETVGYHTRVLTTDPDAVVRRLVRDDVPFEGIRVDRVGLEEAIRAVIAATPSNSPPDPVGPAGVAIPELADRAG